MFIYVYIMFIYVYIKYVHLVILYLLCFCHCFRFSQTLLCHWFKGFQRCFKDFMFQYVSYFKSRNSCGKAPTKTRSRGPSARAMPPHPTPDACETLQQYVATNRSHYGSFFMILFIPWWFLRKIYDTSIDFNTIFGYLWIFLAILKSFFKNVFMLWSFHFLESDRIICWRFTIL